MQFNATYVDSVCKCLLCICKSVISINVNHVGSSKELKRPTQSWIAPRSPGQIKFTYLFVLFDLRLTIHIQIIQIMQNQSLCCTCTPTKMD